MPTDEESIRASERARIVRAIRIVAHGNDVPEGCTPFDAAVTRQNMRDLATAIEDGTLLAAAAADDAEVN